MFGSLMREAEDQVGKNAFPLCLNQHSMAMESCKWRDCNGVHAMHGYNDQRLESIWIKMPSRLAAESILKHAGFSAHKGTTKI